MANEIFSLNNALSQLSIVVSNQDIHWNIYLTALIAILTFISSDYAKQQSKQMHLYLLFSYLIFTVANLLQVYLIQIRINITSDSISTYVVSNSEKIDAAFLPILNALPRMSENIVLSFHVVVDLVVIGVLIRKWIKPEAANEQG